MIEKFNGIIYLIIFLVHFIGTGVYAFPLIIGTKKFIGLGNQKQQAEQDAAKNLLKGKKIDIRGTAEIWRNNSDYYPFYRKMADDTIQGPAVAGGFLSGNPLGIEIKGSKKAIEPEPLEVMARNMQSIISAAMKNEGLSRLMAVYEEGGLAKKILPKDVRLSELNILFKKNKKQKN